jgi:hypothetical protein
MTGTGATAGSGGQVTIRRTFTTGPRTIPRGYGECAGTPSKPGTTPVRSRSDARVPGVCLSPLRLLPLEGAIGHV